MIEQEPVHDVGSDATSNRVRALEHERLAAGGSKRAGTGETGHSRTDNDDVEVSVHVRERTATD